MYTTNHYSSGFLFSLLALPYLLEGLINFSFKEDDSLHMQMKNNYITGSMPIVYAKFGYSFKLFRQGNL